MLQCWNIRLFGYSAERARPLATAPQRVAHSRLMNPNPLHRDRRQAALLAGFAALLLGAVYSRHFYNGFHFDDTHAIVENLWIRDLANLPRFFRDASTMSVLPSNQTFRPLLMTSLAWDYFVGGGLVPLWFHVTSFALYGLLLACLWPLCRALFAHAYPQWARRLASLAVGSFALHPVMAETVNYLVQRADIMATVGVVAALLVHVRLPQWRRYGLYLLPMLLGALAKVPALTLAGVLVLYIWLFECAAQPRQLGTALWRGMPAVVTAAAAAWGIWRMTPPAYVPTQLQAVDYWVTQPYVLVRYVGALFWPTHLSADTDLQALGHWYDSRALWGMAFWILLTGAALAVSQVPRLRVFSLGVGWFVITSLPTSVFVLAEVENDHRMFLPFVGGVLAVLTLLAAAFERFIVTPGLRTRMLTGAAVLGVWTVLAWGSWQRNAVWRDELSLMGDVTRKSPGNARGWMNYGVAQLGTGDLHGALQSLQRSYALNPTYALCATNLGIVHGALGDSAAAERWFVRSMAQAPGEGSAKFYYGRWLRGQGRLDEAASLLQLAVYQNSALLEARLLLMRVRLQQGRGAEFAALVQDTAALAPRDVTVQRMLRLAPQAGDAVGAAWALAELDPSADNYLNLSLLQHRAGRYDDCIASARQALRHRPGDALAYNNIAAAHASLQQWPAAEEAAQKAVRLAPGFELAQNNLAHARMQRLALTASLP